MDDEEIRLVVTRLARAHPSGGSVIERAAIVAEGTASKDMLTWITAHGGTPEAMTHTSTRRGLHGTRLHDSAGSDAQTPFRFVLPAGALD
jgi:hypothetical protein